jgi:hypothetical protein
MAASTPEPKKETVRIKVSPHRPSSSTSGPGPRDTVRIHLPAPSAIDKLAAPVAATAGSHPQSAIETIPLAACWALLAASVVILILQIWNYLA